MVRLNLEHAGKSLEVMAPVLWRGLTRAPAWALRVSMVEWVARAQGNDKRGETGAREGADPVNGQWGALSKCTEDEWGR